jgi:DNA-binding protein VF530
VHELRDPAELFFFDSPRITSLRPSRCGRQARSFIHGSLKTEFEYAAPWYDDVREIMPSDERPHEPAGPAARLVSKDPLHGVTLATMLAELVAIYGWEKMGEVIRIRCFTHKPSISSSLEFLRKTPWARKKTEDWYRITKARSRTP